MWETSFAALDDALRSGVGRGFGKCPALEWEVVAFCFRLMSLNLFAGTGFGISAAKGRGYAVVGVCDFVGCDCRCVGW